MPDEAFIQVLNRSNGKSLYDKFDAESFRSENSRFETFVSGNRFDENGFEIDLRGLKGKVSFSKRLDPWPVTPTAHRIMGWYGMVPFMECFHGEVSRAHSLSGRLGMRNDFGVTEIINLDEGRGYREKDWGKAFPKGYVWIHTKHIEKDPTASLVGSVSIIPWLKGSLRGFIVGLKHSGRLYKFTTYNRAKELQLKIDDQGNNWVLTSKDGRLKLKAARQRDGLLHAPLREAMKGRLIFEGFPSRQYQQTCSAFANELCLVPDQ